MHEIFEQKKVKGSVSKANKDCQILLFDVHVVYRTPKVSSPRRINEDDGEQVARSLHSRVQVLYSVIKAIVLFRSRRRSLLSSYLKVPNKTTLKFRKLVLRGSEGEKSE